MVDANTTRATSKKIKDSSAAKSRNEDVSVANSLIPNLDTTTNLSTVGLGAASQPAPSSRALSGIAPSGTALSGSSTDPLGSITEKRVVNGDPVNSTVHSMLIDMSESRRDRAPEALCHPISKAKTGNVTVSHTIDDDEEDNSPG
ncbi:hypothetical protein PGT21_032654 [Puccinia graminis f. sp. tritici]|uniref:Uncharacterized protein n=1 Tax=Puccinia graminis f. sp. tritici TaxID=56615 RepID=A0A5B0M809_PUCGR|nr:hypothetical protein PGT21_032654 [Puccinia graminis f. sp. tritici]KAA1086353.1 hypothetical protein PGTUg99_018224 [Puccinia graminis f. sp. tritici]